MDADLRDEARKSEVVRFGCRIADLSVFKLQSDIRIPKSQIEKASLFQEKPKIYKYEIIISFSTFRSAVD